MLNIKSRADQENIDFSLILIIEDDQGCLGLSVFLRQKNLESFSNKEFPGKLDFYPQMKTRLKGARKR